MSVLAQIAEDRQSDFGVARVTGEIDASNVKWVERRLRGLLDNRSDGLVVDLTGTTYLDSAGIALMFELAGALRQHQQELRLVVAEGSSIERMVELTGLATAVPTHASLAAALPEPAGA